MSGSTYQRATKRFSASISHLDGDTVKGSIFIPVGVDLEGYLKQISGFMPFETAQGSKLFISVASIKSVMPLESDTGFQDEPGMAKPQDKERSGTKGESRWAYEMEEETPEEKKRRFRSVDSDRMERNAHEHKERMQYEKQKRESMQRQKEREQYPEVVAAFKLLNIPTTATDEEVRAHYRRLVKENHPDRLRGMGANDEQLRQAVDRLSEINQAFMIINEE